VRIIGISLDKGIPELKARVNDKGWNSVEHYWKGGSTADKDWKVAGIPNVGLVDQNGKVVYRGHPMQVDLEDAIS